jgi:hypothetical protein
VPVALWHLGAWLLNRQIAAIDTIAVSEFLARAELVTAHPRAMIAFMHRAL